MKDKTFIITCTMNERWIPYFLGFLRKTQTLGEIGSSREVTLYSDGDGDFRPKYKWDTNNLPIPVVPTKDIAGNVTYDAG